VVQAIDTSIHRVAFRVNYYSPKPVNEAQTADMLVELKDIDTRSLEIYSREGKLKPISLVLALSV
jgi:hypothetical protein